MRTSKQEEILMIMRIITTIIVTSTGITNNTSYENLPFKTKVSLKLNSKEPSLQRMSPCTGNTSIPD